MNAQLLIPWFKAEPVYIPLPFEIALLPNGLPIQPFGVLVAIGVLLGIRLCEEFAKRNGIREEAAYDFAMYTIIPGFIGAYLLNVVFYDFELFLRALTDPSLLLSWHGLSSYGGFFGIAFGVYLWWRRYKISVLRIGDCASFGFPFGWAFGRTGCFVVHDHPGAVTDFPLAVADYVTPDALPPYPARHDLGLYEVFWSIAVSILFLYLWRKPRRPAGLYIALLITLYAPIRFMLDFLRAGVEEGGDVRYFGLTPGHYSSLVFLALGLFLVRHVLRNPDAPLPVELSTEAAVATSGDTGDSTAATATTEATAATMNKTAASTKKRKKR